MIYQSFKRRCTIDKQGIERQKRKNALHLNQTELCFLTIPNQIINTLYKLTSKKLNLGDVVFVNLCISNQICQMLSVIGVRAIAMFQLGFGEIRLYRRIFACLSRQNIKYLYFHLKKEQVSGQKKLISFFVCADKINIIIFYFW